MQQINKGTINNDSSIDDKGGNDNCEFDVVKKQQICFLNFKKNFFNINNTESKTQIIHYLIKQYIVKLLIKGMYFKHQRIRECSQGTIQELKQFLRDNYEIKEKLNIWLLREQKIYNMDKLLQILNNENIVNNQGESNCEEWISKQLRISTFEIQTAKCLTNKNNTLLYSINIFLIKIYGFNSTRKLIKLIQHQGIIKDFFWLKKSEQLFSIGLNYDIFIWNNHCQPQQILKDETNQINSIIANDKDEFFTAGQEYIKFWKKKDSTWNCTQTIDIQLSIKNFRFNPSQTKLILEGYQYDINRDGNVYDYIKNYIILIELQEELWIITRKINIDRFLYCQSYKVFLTENNQFVFLHQTLGILESFNYKPETEEFIRTSIIQYSNSFKEGESTQSQFVPETSTMMIDHKEFIYFFQQDQQGQYSTQQQIKFDKQISKVVISDNRNYLIVKLVDWNRNKILILKLRNIK